MFYLDVNQVCTEDMEDTVLQNGSVRKVARADDQTQGKVTWMKTSMDGRPDPGKNNTDEK
jgi:hypothetical protein